MLKSLCRCPHEKESRSEINSKLSLCICLNCSSLLIPKEEGLNIGTVKPLKYAIHQEDWTPLFLTIPDNPNQNNFQNNTEFRKNRSFIVRKLKDFCTYFSLSAKTYFLALEYLDRVCLQISSSDINDYLQIGQICVILASKFQESRQKTMKMKTYLNLENNIYLKDELFILKLLDYNLMSHTCYDILLDLMYAGFLFQDEKFSLRKMNYLYGKLESMLYFFSGTKYYMDMTHKEVAFSLIGFIREILGLKAFNNYIKNFFMGENSYIQNYYACLQNLRKCFKINDNDNNNNHSDSNTDSNSTNSDSNSENDSETNTFNENYMNNRVQI